VLPESRHIIHQMFEMPILGAINIWSDQKHEVSMGMTFIFNFPVTNKK
jgi:hypothetical protein